MSLSQHWVQNSSPPREDKQGKLCLNMRKREDKELSVEERVGGYSVRKLIIFTVKVKTTKH